LEEKYHGFSLAMAQDTSKDYKKKLLDKRAPASHARKKKPLLPERDDNSITYTGCQHLALAQTPPVGHDLPRTHPKAACSESTVDHTQPNWFKRDSLSMPIIISQGTLQCRIPPN
jgi:hypothetical protein